MTIEGMAYHQLAHYYHPPNIEEWIHKIHNEPGKNNPSIYPWLA
jgi:hypothetical protein